MSLIFLMGMMLFGLMFFITNMGKLIFGLILLQVFALGFSVVFVTLLIFLNLLCFITLLIRVSLLYCLIHGTLKFQLLLNLHSLHVIFGDHLIKCILS